MAKRLRESSISEPPSTLKQSSRDSESIAPTRKEPSSLHLPVLRQGASEPEVITHPSKFVQLDTPDDRAVTMHCSLPPHKTLTFQSYAAYETHYIKSHTNRCSECTKNFPSTHLLDLHQAEAHDPIVAVRRDKGEKTFSCFVEGCEKVCIDWQKRRSHLVDKHLFPRNYDFFVVRSGIDGRRSMLRAGIDSEGHRRSSRDRRGSSATLDTQSTEATTVSQQSDDLVDRARDVTQVKKSVEKEDASLDAVTKSMSSLQFVPRSVTFGKRKGKSGFAKS